jgi:hypothetical protein
MVSVTNIHWYRRIRPISVKSLEFITKQAIALYFRIPSFVSFSVCSAAVWKAIFHVKPARVKSRRETQKEKNVYSRCIIETLWWKETPACHRRRLLHQFRNDALAGRQAWSSVTKSGRDPNITGRKECQALFWWDWVKELATWLIAGGAFCEFYYLLLLNTIRSAHQITSV